ncbi:MAG TPA: EAL domain-containing protein [Steroidobacteraceae bacterium]|nr:EAL domain-containing protein [Steroidobacteraceae bacterium]
MTAAVRVLVVEDCAAEAELSMRALTRAGIGCEFRRVESEAAMREALERHAPQLILSDFGLPGFDGLSALAIARELAPHVPFVFVSGTIGEERAIQALHQGAVDYVLKDNLTRLAPAVRRALGEAQSRAERQRQEMQIAHLTRVLRMLGGVNGAVLRIRDRNELFDECCRLAVAVGGYAACIALLQRPGGRELQFIGSAGADDAAEQGLRTLASSARAWSGGSIRTLLESATDPVVSEARDLPSGLHLLIALPLQLEQTGMGALLLATRERALIGEEELRMLQEVAANLSFALQYQRKGNEVQFLSYFDPLTGLAKRPLFCERLKRLIGRSAQSAARCAIAVVDIENLSIINDSIGRHAGDRLLQHVAERLRRHFHDSECVAQFGGGTFALALAAPGTDAKAVDTLQTRLAAIFDPPFELDGRLIPLGTKSGWALYPSDGQETEGLVQNAEAALRDARAGGHRSLHRTLQQRSEVHARLQLEQQLRLAIERRQFELHYQPIMSLATRRIDGAEALIRWRHPEEGLVAPGAFLPLLESTGLILPVGEWVIEQAAQDRQRWQQLEMPAGRIAVNISPTELHRCKFAQGLLERTQGWSNALCGLDVEITEGALLGDHASVLEQLQRLRNCGICIAIDDFGTGYSSLSRLSELPVDRLKIDRSFIAKLPHDAAGRTLVQTIITLAHAFGMTAVAEGVESVEQLDALVELGCDRVQGFLISRPVNADAYTALLQKDHAALLRRS